MVILALINVYLPGYKAGGPIQSLANLTEKLGDGFQFKIITSDRDTGDATPYPTVTPGKWQQVGNAQVLYLSPGDFAPWNLCRIIERTDYDLLYLNSFFHPIFTVYPMLLRRVGLISRTPVVIAPRGELSPGALGLKKLRKRLFLSAEKVLDLYSSATWQASTVHEMAEIQHCLPAAGGAATNAVVAPDLPGGGSFKTVEPILTSREPKKPGRLRLLFASRVSPKKNLLEAIRCLESVQGAVEFNVVGPIDDQSYWHKCQKAAKALPPEVGVRHWGPVPHDRVLFEMGQHELFFLPTLGENYGHAILESMSASCPVLIGTETPWRELASKHAGWDLPADDRSGFTSVLQRCIDMDESEHSRWRAGARTLAAGVVLDDAPLRSNRDLFLQAMQLPADARPRRRQGRKTTSDFPIAESRSYFNALAASWERKYERDGAFQRRADSFVRGLRQFAPNSAHVLDFGCGSGDIAMACIEAGFEITGIDLSSAMIARARLRSYGRGIVFDLLESENPVKLPYPDAYFDGVMASSVLEYVRNPFECLKELRRVCKPGAVLIATVPNVRHPQRWAEVVLRHPTLRKSMIALDRYRSYGGYLDVSRNRFPLTSWIALLGLSGWPMETALGRARSLVMLIARVGAPRESQLSSRDHDSSDSEHALHAEA